MRKVKLLVIINDPDSLVIYKTFFEMKKIQVSTSKSWLKGLKVFNRLKPDVVIIDSKILKFNPEETLKLIKKKEDIKIRLIILTPYGEPNHVHANTNHGIIEHVSKSARLSHLLKVIKKIK